MINIYYLEYCPHSQKALQTLKEYNINHSKIESSNNKNERKQFYSTFPQIYYNDNFIGGNSDFTNIINTLQTNNIPKKPNEWAPRKWIGFLLEVAKKL